MPTPAFSKCQDVPCGESAISFSPCCWAHTSHDNYLKDLPGNLKSLSNSPSPVNFKKVEAEDLDFSQLNLNDSSFSQARLSSCNFIGADLKEVDAIGTIFKSCDFVGSDLRKANMTRSILINCSFSHSDLQRAYLVEVHFRDVDFMGAILRDAVLWNADLSGAKNLKKKNFNDPEKSRRLSKPTLSESNSLMAFESYRILKHHLHQKGLYEDASWAAYRELTMERKHLFETRNPRFIPSLMMDLLSGYTQKPNRVIISSLIIIFTFGLMYYIFSVPMPANDTFPQHTGFWDNIYFSFITFTTVGYGDLIPKPVAWLRILTCVEAFSGPFMAGLYIFTLTRRYAAS